MNVEKVYPRVRKIIADVLVIDEQDIDLKSRLIADLGAESIDFLDLVFQLEKNLVSKYPWSIRKKCERTLGGRGI